MMLSPSQLEILDHLLTCFENSETADAPSDSISNLPPPRPSESLFEFHQRQLIFLNPAPPPEYVHTPIVLPDSTTVTLNLEQLMSTMLISRSTGEQRLDLKERISSAKDAQDKLISRRTNEAYKALGSDRRVKVDKLSKEEIRSARESLKNKLRNFMSKNGIEFPDCTVPHCNRKSTDKVLPASSIPYEEWYRVVFLCSHHASKRAGSGTIENLPTVDVREDMERKPQQLSADAARARVKRLLDKHPDHLKNPPCQICEKPEVDPTFKRVRRFWPDYNRWFEVCFLCDKHYHDVKSNARPWPRPIDVRPPLTVADEPFYEAFHNLKDLLNAKIPHQCDVCGERTNEPQIYIPRKQYPTEFFVVCPDHDDPFSREEILNPDFLEPHRLGDFCEDKFKEAPGSEPVAQEQEEKTPRDFDDIMDEVLGME